MHHRALLFLFLWVMIGVSTSFSAPRQQPHVTTNHTVFLPLISKPGAGGGGNPLHTGEATYYTEADGSGNCSFDPIPGDLMVGAMNHVDYADAALCGAFVAISGPHGDIMVRIVDQCPECLAGDIDLSPLAFSQIADLSSGRVPISWRIVSPDISGPIRYRIKEGSNQWWTAVQIRNHRNPITSVEYRAPSGQFVALPRADYNYFVAESGLGVGPYSFRVTDTYGNVLIDSGISLQIGVEQPGSGQFPKAP
jgi:expansin (peptidoglycan-binding protein)